MKKLLVPNLSSTLVAKSGQIFAVFHSELFKQDFIKFLNQHCCLYYGNPRQDYFLKIFQQEKDIFLEGLVFCESTTEIDSKQPAGFKMFLTRVAPADSWSWPALLNQQKSASYNPVEMFHWQSGCGRVTASGLSYKEPWKHLKILVLQDRETPADLILENPQEVVDSPTLHRLLGLNFNDVFSLQIEFSDDNDYLGLALKYLHDGDDRYNFHAGDEILENFLDWKQRYPRNSKLWIYTDWPDKITDSKNYWKKIIAGGSPMTNQTKPRMGMVELGVIRYCNQPVHDLDHVLHVFDPRPIDVSELLAWCDLKHSASIEKNMDFVLFKPIKPYAGQLVSVSYF